MKDGLIWIPLKHTAHTYVAGSCLSVARALGTPKLLECNPHSKSKIGRSFGLHSRVLTPIRSAIQFSIQNRPEFWIVLTPWSANPNTLLPDSADTDGS